MLDIIRNKITNIATTFTVPALMSKELLKVAEDIKKYQEEDQVSSDLHRTFKMLQRYSNMYKIAVDKYMAMPMSDLEGRSFQLQEILCLLSLATSVINNVLRKYNTSDDKGTLGKHLRTLNNNLEYYKNEKISWTTMLKAITTIISDRIADKKLKMQEATLNMRGEEIA